MPNLCGENASVQRPFIKYAQEAGWEYLSPDQASQLWRGLTSLILDSVLIDQLQRLNVNSVDHLRAEQLRDRLVAQPHESTAVRAFQ